MPKEQNLSVPVAIVLAGALIAVSVYFAGHGTAPTTNTNTNPSNPTAAAVKTFVPVSASDHILGSPTAKVAVVEYTDLECPFCKQFHETMQQVMDKYGKSGQVMWVLRNFPLQQLHPNAPKIALAAECVAELGGNTAYWNFISSLFKQAPIGTFFDMTKLASTAGGVGVDEKKFNACVSSGKYNDKVQKEYNDALAAGGNGTPYSVVVVVKTGKTVAIPGSQPLEQVIAVIDEALK